MCCRQFAVVRCGSAELCVCPLAVAASFSTRAHTAQYSWWLHPPPRSNCPSPVPSILRSLRFPTNKEHVTPLETSIMELSESLMNVQEEQKFFKSREHTHRDSKLSSHTPMLSAHGMCCTCGAAFSPWRLASRVDAAQYSKSVLLNGLLGSRNPSSNLWFIPAILRHEPGPYQYLSLLLPPPWLDQTRSPSHCLLYPSAVALPLRPVPPPPTHPCAHTPNRSDGKHKRPCQMVFGNGSRDPRGDECLANILLAAVL